MKNKNLYYIAGAVLVAFVVYKASQRKKASLMSTGSKPASSGGGGGGGFGSPVPSAPKVATPVIPNPIVADLGSLIGISKPTAPSTRLQRSILPVISEKEMPPVSNEIVVSPVTLPRTISQKEIQPVVNPITEISAQTTTMTKFSGYTDFDGDLDDDMDNQF